MKLLISNGYSWSAALTLHFSSHYIPHAIGSSAYLQSPVTGRRLAAGGGGWVMHLVCLQGALYNAQGSFTFLLLQSIPQRRQSLNIPSLTSDRP